MTQFVKYKAQLHILKARWELIGAVKLLVCMFKKTKTYSNEMGNKLQH